MTSNSELPIGVFDSGVGGLTVLRALKQRMPNESFIYLGDTARTPYGSKGPETIVRYAHECATFLQQQRIKLLVIACNTASSFAYDQLRERFSFPVVGTVGPAIEAVVALEKVRSVAVIGTSATISSGIFERALIARLPDVVVESRACPLFVPLVEEGLTSGKLADAVVEHYLSEFEGSTVDTLLLGCTHYPLLRDQLQSFLGEQVRLVTCSDAIASSVESILNQSNLRANSAGKAGLRCFVTDAVERFLLSARLFLQSPDLEVERVKIESS